MLNLLILKTPLRCLMHPASVAAVLLLLLNDHILKSAVPSFFTGKLSDFAGLFFFPFLLASLLALLAAPLSSLRGRALGLTSFITTAIWFAAAKGTVAGNIMMVELVSALSGRRAEIIFDPTDLAALLILFPAWHLWRRQEQRGDEPLERRVAFPVLLLATLAAMATPPTRETRAPGATELFVIHGTLCAIVGGNLGGPAYRTSDHGKSWVRVEPPFAPADIGDTLVMRSQRINQEYIYMRSVQDSYAQSYASVLEWHKRVEDSLGYLPKEYPEHKKYFTDSLIRYTRIRDSLAVEVAALSAMAVGYILPERNDTIFASESPESDTLYRSKRGSTLIERSDDGGWTWTTEWEIPEGRYLYMQRQLDEYEHLYNIGIADMQLSPDGEGWLMVTLGTAGIAARNPEGEWKQYPINGVDAIEPSATSLNEMTSSLTLEWFALLALGIAAGVVLNGAAWKIVVPKDSTSKQRRPRTFRRIIILLPVIALALWGNAVGEGGAMLALLLIFFLPPALIFVVMILSDWGDMHETGERESHISRVTGICKRGVAAAILLPLLCMMLWTLGGIVSYQMAAIAAVVLWMGIVVGGVVMVRKYGRGAPQVITA